MGKKRNSRDKSESDDITQRLADAILGRFAVETIPLTRENSFSQRFTGIVFIMPAEESDLLNLFERRN